MQGDQTPIEMTQLDDNLDIDLDEAIRGSKPHFGLGIEVNNEE